MATAQTQQPARAPAAGRGDQTATAPTAGVQMRAALRGADFAEAEALLSPGPTAGPVQRKARGAPVQMDEAADKVAATALEASEGGHSLARHGPEVSDQALQDRLTTGVAPDGKVSPAPGLSTKFASHGDYLKTRDAAGSALKTAFTTATSTLQSAFDAVGAAKTAFESEPAGPGKGQKSKDLATKKNDLKAAVTGIGQESTDKAPVKYVQTGKNPEDMVVIYGSYGVVMDHGRAVGSGFEGQGEKSAAHPTDASKDDITVYDKTTSISGGVSQTQTTFEPPKSGEKLFGVTHAPSTWRAVQHFPTQGTNGISV